MISNFSFKNFKCFRNTGDINLSPITILVGPNNSGKSSIIGALNIMSLTASSEDKDIYLKLLSRDYDYGTFKDISFNHDNDNIIEFTLVAPKPKKKTFFLVGDGLKLDSPNISLKLRFGFLKQRQEIYLESLSLLDGNEEIFKLTEEKYSKKIKNYIKDIPREFHKKLSFLCYKKGITYDWRMNYDTYKKLGETNSDKLQHISMLLDYFLKSLTKIYHLGPLRMPPSRSYLFSGEISDKIGGTGEKALLNYATLAKRRISKEHMQIDNINQALYKLGFLKEFKFNKVGERHYEYWTKHPNSNLWANLADTGFGASQVLPVLLLLYTSQENSLLLIEQPELHLHPAAQAELGSIFVNACLSRNIKTVIETHSETLLLRLQTEVAKGNLSPDSIAIYYVNPQKEEHKVIKIPMNAQGEFLREWPRGFFEEGYLESIRLSKARGGIIE